MSSPLPECSYKGLLPYSNCRLFDQVDQYVFQNNEIFPWILINYCGDGSTPEQVARKRCEVSVLGDVQSAAGHSPGQPAVVSLSLRRGIGLGDLQRCLPSSTVLWFCGIFQVAIRVLVYYVLLSNTWTLMTNNDGYCFLELVEERHHWGERLCCFVIFKHQLNSLKLQTQFCVYQVWLDCQKGQFSYWFLKRTIIFCIKSSFILFVWACRNTWEPQVGTRNIYCEVLSVYKVKIKAFPKETCSPNISVLKTGTSVKKFQINLHGKEKKKGYCSQLTTGSTR